MNTSPTLPTPTENTDIDTIHNILLNFSMELPDTGTSHRQTYYEQEKRAYATAKAAISKKLRAERIDELTRFKLPEYDHTKCIDQRSCIGYQNAQSDFDNEKLIRLAALQAEETS